MHIEDLPQSAQTAADAGQMYAKTPETADKAIEAFRRAVQLYRENSRPSNAARLLCDAAKLFQESGDRDSAISALADAVVLYDDEKQPVQATSQLVIIADLLAQQKKWLEAAAKYKEVAERRMGDRLTQLAAGEYFMKAGLCQLAGEDSVAAQNTVNDGVLKNAGWERSREYVLLVAAVKSYEERDAEAFSQACAEYDQIKRLDNWMTEVLTIIKGLIEAEDDLR
jgi:alpha-soluble NSF attachment protein